jgi:hypothetical protein
MTEEKIARMIQLAIAAHEFKVAIFSGIGGFLLLAGTWHAIWICRHSCMLLQ